MPGNRARVIPSASQRNAPPPAEPWPVAISRCTGRPVSNTTRTTLAAGTSRPRGSSGHRRTVAHPPPGGDLSCDVPRLLEFPLHLGGSRVLVKEHGLPRVARLGHRKGVPVTVLGEAPRSGKLFSDDTEQIHQPAPRQQAARTTIDHHENERAVGRESPADETERVDATRPARNVVKNRERQVHAVVRPRRLVQLRHALHPEVDREPRPLGIDARGGDHARGDVDGRDAESRSREAERLSPGAAADVEEAPAWLDVALDHLELERFRSDRRDARVGTHLRLAAVLVPNADETVLRVALEERRRQRVTEACEDFEAVDGPRHPRCRQSLQDPPVEPKYDRPALDGHDATEHLGAGRGGFGGDVKTVAIGGATEQDGARAGRAVAYGLHVDDLVLAERWRRVQEAQPHRRRGAAHRVLGGRAKLFARLEEDEAAHPPPRITSSLSSSSRTKSCTSVAARSGVTSNSRTITSTISSTLRRPSISSHTRLPTGFSPRKAFVSSERMTASPSMTRQAVLGLRERIIARAPPRRGRAGAALSTAARHGRGGQRAIRTPARGAATEAARDRACVRSPS